MTIRFIHPSLGARLAACALLAAYFLFAAFTPTAAQQTAPKVSMPSEGNTVRLNLEGEARAWRLEVFSLSGDLLYASGPVNDRKIEWPLQDRHGEPLGGGMYSYTLNFLDERDETAAIRRGYFVVDVSHAGAHVWMAA